MSDKITVLLTGASGTVGLECLKQLVKIPTLEITVFDKKTKASVKKLSPFREQVELVYGDITNLKQLQKVASNKDVVIHLAAIIPPLADDAPKLAQNVNTEGTRNLVQLLEKQSPQCFFIYSSSISVYGDRLKNPYIKVGDPLTPSPGDEYALTKIASEEILQNSKLDWTIFRLAAIMGGHKMSKLMFHQPLDTSLEIATPSDTARAFVNAIQKQKQLSKRIFNLGGGETCRIPYKDFLIRSFKIYGLGEFTFPDKAFAEKNFHCGYYEDGDDLEEILHFRQDSLDDFFQNEKENFSSFKRLGASLFQKPIKWYLLQQSEPLKALKNDDKKLKEQFFN
ncbi:NAD-dependent epimerase/dehydratase family protein [Mesonia ostreae]|uniref:NAD(P)-dependent oxidoreductase n=1 Tax=Mesonia ostreae TaxID=861110 RepID=A0ABU2KJN2_9FLAO|nr:NAD(P)-dependent oxidoreductase [Mesonia ostreae]MDT0294913.1 NAD(P)-dependent oxidoreductase [Mesonia ostreae]